jgi:mono/diheme cytochrome c family protein
MIAELEVMEPAAFEQWLEQMAADKNRPVVMAEAALPTSDAIRTRDAERLYKTYCASCHGEQGRGDGPASAGLTPRPPDLTHVTEHHRDGEVAWKIATGRGAMPGWKNTLSEKQIWNVVNYLKSIGSQGHGGHRGAQESREKHR